jgi:tellurite methyltransferase
VSSASLNLLHLLPVGGTGSMLRTIEGFHRDDDGEWVAELSCLHNQHVRHRPPFQDRAWVLAPGGRAERVGTPADCPLCDRAELPDGLVVARSAGPFEAATLPEGLRRTHRVAERTWGLVRVVSGAVGLSIETDPPLERRLTAPATQAIPPTVPHRVTVDGPVRLFIDFLVRQA